MRRGCLLLAHPGEEDLCAALLKVTSSCTGNRLCKHYFPNQQTPFLGRKIRYVVAILEEGSQGARSPWHSFGVVWDPLLDYWGGVFWSGVSGCFRVLVFFVLFSTGTASRLAPKSC